MKHGAWVYSGWLAFTMLFAFGCATEVQVGPLADGTMHTMKLQGGNVKPFETDHVQIEIVGVGATIDNHRVDAFHTFGVRIKASSLIKVVVWDVSDERPVRLLESRNPQVSDQGRWFDQGPSFVVRPGQPAWLTDGKTDFRFFKLEFTFADGVSETVYQASKFGGDYDEMLRQLREKS